MADINNFVEVQIRLQTGGVTVTGFGTMLIAGYHTAATERYLVFGDADAAADAGIDNDHGILGGLIYNAIVTAFSQYPRPSRVAVGRVQVNSLVGTVLEAVDGREYKVWLNDTEYSYTATVPTDTVDTIAAALAALLTAVTGFTAAGVGSGGEYTLDVDTPGTAFKFSVDDNQTAAPAATGNEDFDTALAAIRDENDDFYGVIATARDVTQQEKIAEYIEAADSVKFYRPASNDANIINLAPAGDTASIAAIAKAKAFKRTSVIYHSKASGDLNDEFIDSAWTVMALGYNPDVETATDKFKTLVGITPDEITGTQRANAIGTEESPTSGKNANIYTTVAGANVTQSGITGAGEWNDIIFGADWLKVRMEERIYRAFRINPKIPYTDAGIAAIVAEIRAQLNLGLGTGYLAFDEQWDKVFGYLVEYPARANVPSADVANRILKGVKFTATVAGAIHAAKPIIGTLTV